MKPQFAPRRLDEADASPHLDGMGKSEDPEKPKPSEREAKLARALRANLRRRKAESPPKKDGEPSSSVVDKD